MDAQKVFVVEPLLEGRIAGGEEVVEEVGVGGPGLRAHDGHRDRHDVLIAVRGDEVDEAELMGASVVREVELAHRFAKGSSSLRGGWDGGRGWGECERRGSE